VKARSPLSPIVECLRRVLTGDDLAASEMHVIVTDMMTGDATAAQAAALLVALAAKGETVEEITGAARALRAGALRVETTRRPIVDVCGTGGDGSGSFNVSTAVALVVAGAGVALAKHGNRAVTGRCGSADVLAELGVTLDATPASAARSLEQHGIAFLFAPLYHPSMRHIALVRREIGVSTLFNVLGPLANPAGAQRQLVGVAQRSRLRLVTESLARLGSERAAAVRGEDGLDEFSLCGPSRIVEWNGSTIREYVRDPLDFGMKLQPRSAIAGGDARHNARVIRRVLDGAAGAHRDVVVLNAGLALEIAGAAGSMADGCDLARSSIDSGAARGKLDALLEASRR